MKNLLLLLGVSLTSILTAASLNLTAAPAIPGSLIFAAVPSVPTPPPPPPAPTVSGDTSLCPGDTTVLIASTGTPTDTIRWYIDTLAAAVFEGDTFETSPAVTTKYFVRGFDATGAGPVDSITVTVHPANNDAPQVAPAAQNTCPGNTATFTASSFTGNSVNFIWYDASSGGNALDTTIVFTSDTLQSSATFYAEGVDTFGCLSSVRGSGTAIVSANADVVSVSPTPGIVCPGDSTTLVASSGTGFSTTFHWYDSATGGTLLHVGDTFNTGPVSDTTFYVSGVDSNGCESTRASAPVITTPNLDIISISPPLPLVCVNATVTLVATTNLGASVTFEWFDNIALLAPLFIGDTLIIGPIVSDSTLYAVGIDTNGCRSAPVAVTITLSTNLDLVQATPNPATICPGDSAQFVASSIGSSSVEFAWYDQSSGGTLLHVGDTFNTGPLAASEIYYLEGRDTIGCASSRQPVFAIVSVNNDIVTVSPPTTTACPEDTVMFVASTTTGASTSFKWFTELSGGTPIFVGDTFFAVITSDTTFYVEGADTADCATPARATATVTLTPNNDIITVDPAVSQACPGDTVTLVAASTTGASTDFAWYDVPSGGTPIFIGDTFRPGPIVSDTTFYVEGADSAGCISQRTAAQITLRNNLDAVSVQPPGAAICPGDTVTFVATSNTGASVEFRWYDQSTGGTPIFIGDTFTTVPMGDTTFYVAGVDTSGCETPSRTAAVVVTQQNTDVVVVTPPTQTACPGDTVTFVASSGTGNSTAFNWFDALTDGNLVFTGDTFLIASDTTVTYYVEGVDSNGCASARSSATLVITVNPDAIFVTPASAQVCPGDTVIFTAASTTGGSVDFLWFDTAMAGTELFQGNPFEAGPINQAITYYVAGIDSNGCVSNRTAIPVTINTATDVITVNPPAPAVCPGDTVTLTATSLLGNSVQFHWYDTASGGTPLFTGNPYDYIATSTITLYVEGEDVNGCRTSRYSVTVLVTPAADAILVTPPTALACPGDTLEFVAASSTGNSVIFEWYDVDNGGAPIFVGDTFNPIIGGDTTFYVGGVDATGCRTLRTPVSVTVQPNLDVVMVTPAFDTICPGDSSIFVATSTTGNSINYAWYTQPTGGTPVFTGDTFRTGTLSSDTTFYVAGINTQGCESPRTPAPVILQPNPDIIAVNPPAATPCVGDTLQFIATSGTGMSETFNWYNVASGGTPIFTGDTFNLVVLQDTTLYVEGVNSIGCPSPRTSVGVLTLPNADVILVTPPTATICAGDSATFVAATTTGNSVQYHWFDQLSGGNEVFVGDTFNTGMLFTNTTYFVEGANANGCRSPRTPVAVVVTTNPDVVVTDPIIDTICPGASAMFVAGSTTGSSETFYWYDDAASTTPIFVGDTFISGPIFMDSTFYVEGADSIGCRTSRSPAAVSVQPSTDVVVVTPQTTTVCPGDTVNFIAASSTGASVQFNWYRTATDTVIIFTGDTFNTGPLSNDTTVFVQGVDSNNGCPTARVMVRAMVNGNMDTVLVTPDTTIVCPGETATFTASSGNGQSVVFSWYTTASGGTPVFVGSTFTSGALTSDTTFYAEGSNASGCVTDTRTAAVALLSINSDTVTAQAVDITVCAGDSTYVTANSSQGNTQFNWYDSPNGTTPIFTGDSVSTGALQQDTTFYVASVNADGCESARDSVSIIVVPTMDTVLTQNDTVCAGDTAVLTAMSTSGFPTLRWYSKKVGGVLLHTGTSLTLPGLQNDTTFFIESIDTFTGCASLRFPVTAFAQRNNDVITVKPSSATVCVGGDVTMVATSALGHTMFNWYDSATGGNLLATGDTFNTGALLVTSRFYVETVDTITGCLSKRKGTTVFVVVSLATPTINGPDTLCTADSALLIATSPDSGVTFTWWSALVGGSIIFTGDTMPIAITQTTDYYVQAESGPSCTSARVQKTVVAEQAGVVLAPVVMCASETNTSITITWDTVANAIGYQVSTNGGATWFTPSEGADTTVHKQTRQGNETSVTFIVRAISDTAGCFPTYGDESKPVTCNYTTGFNPTTIYNSFTPNRDGFNETWIIDGIDQFPNNVVKVFNRWGQLVFDEKGYNNTTVVFDGDDLPDGAYYYVVLIPSLRVEAKGTVMIIR